MPMQPSAEELTSRLVRLMEEMAHRLRPQHAGGWGDIELTMPQVRVLMLLHEGPQRVSRLASQLCTTVPSATAMLDRLANKGLVERSYDSADRRVVTCGLTEAGRAEVERMWRLGRLHLEEVAAYLTQEELERVVAALEIMAAALRRGRTRAAV